MADENNEIVLDKPVESGIMTSGETEGEKDGNGESTQVSRQRREAEGYGTGILPGEPPEAISGDEEEWGAGRSGSGQGASLSGRSSEPYSLGGVGERGLEPGYPVTDTGERERITTPRDIILTDDSDVDADVGPAARFDANLKALRTIKALEAEGRQATPEEQSIIAKFSGFGDSAFNDAFDRYEREGIW